MFIVSWPLSTWASGRYGAPCPHAGDEYLFFLRLLSFSFNFGRFRRVFFLLPLLLPCGCLKSTCCFSCSSFMCLSYWKWRQR